MGAIVVTLMFSHASQFLTGKRPFAAGWLDQVSDQRRVIAFLLFPESSAVNGALIPVTGR